MISRFCALVTGLMLVFVNAIAFAQSAGEYTLTLDELASALRLASAIVFFVVFLVAVLVGKLLARFLSDNTRKIVVSALVVVIGAALAIYGVSAVIFTILDLIPNLYDSYPVDETAPWAIVVSFLTFLIIAGFFFVVLGFTMLLSKGRSIS